MNSLLEITGNYGETLTFGGQVVLIGMLTVFAVLGLLWAFLTVFKVVFHDLPQKRAAQIVPAAPVAEELPAEDAYTAGDDEIVAVIAAAIAAAESENAGAKFKVVSFRRK